MPSVGIREGTRHGEESGRLTAGKGSSLLEQSWRRACYNLALWRENTLDSSTRDVSNKLAHLFRIVVSTAVYTTRVQQPYLCRLDSFR